MTATLPDPAEGTSAPEPSAAAVVGPGALREGRLEFLDALRGIAALAVAMQHGAEILWPRYLRWSVEVFRPGEFGVFVFFICSGFIIPASLEKHGSVERFWIGRGFRLFPLYWFGLLSILVLHGVFDLYPVVPHLSLIDVTSNLTMVQGMAAQPNLIGASWTLAYEMCFYLGCTLLLVTGLSRRSAPIALTLLGASMIVGSILPVYLLSTPGGHQFTIPRIALVVAVVAVTIRVATRLARPDRGTRRLIIGISVVLVPLVMNRGESFWFCLFLFGIMFTGTVLYRWHRGQVSATLAFGVAGFSAFAYLVGGIENFPPRIDKTLAYARHTWHPEALTYLVAVGLFCAALALRHRTFPRWLTYLGAISFSVYLAHAIVIHTVPQVGEGWLALGVWMAVIIAVSAATHRWIELPFQRLGRTVAASQVPARPSA